MNASAQEQKKTLWCHSTTNPNRFKWKLWVPPAWTSGCRINSSQQPAFGIYCFICSRLPFSPHGALAVVYIRWWWGKWVTLVQCQKLHALVVWCVSLLIRSRYRLDRIGQCQSVCQSRRALVLHRQSECAYRAPIICRCLATNCDHFLVNMFWLTLSILRCQYSPTVECATNNSNNGSQK